MKRKGRSGVALGLAVLLTAVAAMTGCGGGQRVANTQLEKVEGSSQTTDSGEPITITYWHHDASDNIVTPLKKIVADFEAENPDIKVEFLALPSDSFYQKYVTAIATNTAPDAFGVRDAELLALVNQKALIPMDDYINQWDEKEKIPKRIWDFISSYSDDKKIYMIPSYMNSVIMWYNTQKMKELGISEPKTLDEFLADCEKYANPKENSYFYSLRGGVGSYDNLFSFLMTYAGADGFFDKEGDCVLNQDIFVEAMDKYAGIYKNGWVSKDSVTNAYKEMIAEFGSGIAMSILHNSTSAIVHRQNLGEGNFMNAMPPTGKNGKASIPLPSFIGASVTTQSKHPKEAARFVLYLASHKAASYFCEIAGKTPINDLIYQDSWCEKDPYISKYSELLTSDAIALYNNPIWLPEWATFVSQDVVTDFQAVLLGEKESKEVLNGWADKLTTYQQKYLKEK